MQWEEKIQLIISISFALILLPCLLTLYLSSDQSLLLGMPLLYANLPAIGFQIVFLLMTATYFAVQQHMTQPPEAVVYSHCYKGSLEKHLNKTNRQSIKNQRALNDEEEEVCRQLWMKEKVIFQQ